MGGFNFGLTKGANVAITKIIAKDEYDVGWRWGILANCPSQKGGDKDCRKHGCVTLVIGSLMGGRNRRKRHPIIVTQKDIFGQGKGGGF